MADLAPHYRTEASQCTSTPDVACTASSPSLSLLMVETAAAACTKSEPEPCTIRDVRTVWLLTNAPSPYQSELLAAIAERPDIKLAVRLMRPFSSAGRSALQTTDSRSMRGLAPKSWRDEFRLHPRAVWECATGDSDCHVLSGLYTSVTFLCCAATLSARRKPWIAWMERPRQLGSANLSRWYAPLRWLRDHVRLRLLQSATRVLCIGTAGRNAYSAMGLDVEKLDNLPYCCDIDRYDSVSDHDADEWRTRHNLSPDSTVFLFSGQLIARKGVETLIEAFNRLASEDSSASLVILGDGALREELESRVDAEHRRRVHFLGHLPQTELPIAFRACDVFVFPSRHDGWGVVINEACAARLPIVATRQTGAAHDLVEDGKSGYLHDAGDVRAFYQSMKLLLADPARRERMGQRSRELVEAYSPARGAELFAKSIARAVE